MISIRKVKDKNEEKFLASVILFAPEQTTILFNNLSKDLSINKIKKCIQKNYLTIQSIKFYALDITSI